MEQIREELDNVLLKVCRIQDLNELLVDYFDNELYSKKYSKGDTLLSLISEKLKDLDGSISELYKRTHEIEKGGQA